MIKKNLLKKHIDLLVVDQHVIHPLRQNDTKILIYIAGGFNLFETYLLNWIISL